MTYAIIINTRTIILCHFFFTMYGQHRRHISGTTRQSSGTTASRIEQYLNKITPEQLRSIPQAKVECLLECREALESAKHILKEFREGDDTTKTVQEQIDARLDLLKGDLLKRVMGNVVKGLLEGSDDTEGRATKVTKHSGDSDVHHHAADPYIVEKEVYHGTLKHGKRHGQGTLTTSRFFYKGHFKDNQPHGSGMKKYKNADGNEVGWYIGDFECGLRHGKGTLVDLRDKDNEIRFQGIFVENKCVQGKVTTKTEEYEDPLLNELYEGMGKLRIKMDDGGIHEYTGTFRQGFLVGKAKLRALKDEEELLTIEGPFSSSHFTGLCSVVSPFVEYDGYLVDGEYHGKGTMKHTGFTYRGMKCIAFDKGQWKSNMKHGKHVMKVYIAEGYNSSSRPVMEIESVFDNDVVKGNAKVRHYYIPEDTHMKRILDSEYVGCLSNEYLYDGKGVKTHKKYIYDGLYSNNLRHGKGVYTDVVTGIVVKGEFDDNFLDGRHVEVTYASGDVYEGQIKQDWNTHEFPEEEYLTSLTRNGSGVLKYGGGGLSHVSAVWEDDYPHIDLIMKRIHTNVKDGYVYGV